MKLFSKVMVNRLNPHIPALVDPDQTGFVHGRSIAENFIYAADLLSCCHKRNVPTAVLKLDFKKAFDSVEWQSLDAILQARGFNSRWRGWVSTILRSGKTAVLLNGVPGRWIPCRRGLRQGDPLSPFLFIIVADVLQRLLQQASLNGDLVHPIDSSLPCPVLQYADDTLILTRGDVHSMSVLKHILDSFSAATGLAINFHKSTFVPMNVDDATATTMADILGCLRSSFPQTYLGLPLSPQKLRVSDFQPLLTSFDRYLASWKARLLSAGGRIVLVNAVLGSLPIYYMSSTLVPKTVRDLLDAKRRAFFWTGEEKCSGANCLVAWERVCQSRSAGGLGIKNMEDVNHCLLLKFVHKLHEDEPLPWKRWFISHAGDDFGGDPDSYLSKLVLMELPRYRSLTKVQLGSGVRVSFWHDKWLLDDSLAERFPILYSHTVSDATTVQAVMGSGLRQQLRPRLTHAAAAEFLALTDHLSQVTLRDRPDTRFLDVQGLVPFSTRNAYHVLHTPATVSDIARVWDARLPTKLNSSPGSYTMDG